MVKAAQLHPNKANAELHKFAYHSVCEGSQSQLWSLSATRF